MSEAERGAETAVLRAARADDQEAIARLTRLIGDYAWTVCRRLCRDETRARAATADFLQAARADGFALLAGYDGRGKLGTFIVLLAREFLAGRLRQAIAEVRAHAWADFAALFDPDLRRIILRRLPGGANETAREDAYQDICLGLVADNWQRLRVWSGSGSFGLQTADRLLLDALRRQSGRVRAPRALDRLSPLAREIHRLRRAEGLPAEPAVLLTRLAGHGDPPPDRAAVVAALRQLDALDAALPAASGPRGTVPLPETANDTIADTAGASPEESLLRAEGEAALDAAAAALRQTMADLPERERAYLRIALGGGAPLPAREIARLMGEPVAEIYQLKQRLLPRLKAALTNSAAVKNWVASVLPE